MNDRIDAVIIDDEENFSSSLEILLRKNFPKINIVGEANSVKNGVALINKTKPKLIFLDINLPDGAGFDILEQTDYKSYSIIFTTSFSEFALRAFEFSAIHYLMKPMTIEKLREAIDRYEKTHDKDFIEEKLKILKESLIDRPKRILLPTIDGIGVFNVSDIIRCEADNNYSIVYFNNKQKLVLSKPLQYLDKMLIELDFVRTHSKHLVNLRYVKKFGNGRKSFVQLTDNTELPISQTQKIEFAERLKLFAKGF
jgi:two-component system LytT family response regulator